ncbi:MAG: hypothetical protein CL910_10700 [Deltaproteobacteria bacterium]|nr:hypothetical protein [Deltaproteobacteria bacterium]
MEHLSTFKLQRDPFANEPQLSFYYESPAHQDAERRLVRAAMQSKGLSVVTGVGGVGKTLLVRHYLEALEEEVFEACMLVPIPGITDGRWILDRFARQLGVEEPAEDSQRVMAQIYEQLAIVREDGRQTVLIFDEAQVLADQGLLGELRGLLNLEYEDRRLLCMVLVGLDSLDDAIREEPALCDRVDLRVDLAPLDATYAAQYLTHRILTAGGNPAILEAPAVDALVKHSRGVPRHLNSLADNALFEAHLAGRVSASAADVERAVAELRIWSDEEETEDGPELAPPVPQPAPREPKPRSEPVELSLEAPAPASSQPGFAEAPSPGGPAPGLPNDDGVAPLEFGPGAPAESEEASMSPLLLTEDDGATDGELDNLFADLVED